jgi:hypothetical protein
LEDLSAGRESVLEGWRLAAIQRQNQFGIHNICTAMAAREVGREPLQFHFPNHPFHHHLKDIDDQNQHPLSEQQRLTV